MSDPQRPTDDEVLEPADEQLIDTEVETDLDQEMDPESDPAGEVDIEAQAEDVEAQPETETPAGVRASERRQADESARKRDGASRKAEDELPYVDDRVSKIWVLLIVGTFAAIFAYGLLFGQAGMLTPGPTPTPSPSPTPIASPTAVPSATPTPSPTAATSPATSPPASPSTPASPSVAPPS